MIVNYDCKTFIEQATDAFEIKKFEEKLNILKFLP